MPENENDVVVVDTPDTTLKTLTKKQEKFAHMMAGGETLTESYRESYKTQGKESTVRSEAHKVSRYPHVAARIAEIKAERAGHTTNKGKISQSYVLDGLQREAEDMTKGTSASRTRALELLGKAQGMFDDTVIIKDARTPESIEAELRKRLMDAFGIATIEALETDETKMLEAAVHDEETEGEEEDTVTIEVE